MKVTNIKKQSKNYASLLKTDKNLKEAVKYLPHGVKPLDILPHGTQELVDFKLEKTTSDFANAIRIALMEESEVQSLEITSWESDDVFIVSDYLENRIEGIPIQQEVDYKKKKITLDVTNGSRDMLKVMSSDIKVDGKYNNSKYFEDTFIIARLRPGKSIKVEMQVVSGDGRTNANKFANIANIRYRPENKPLNEETGEGKSSLEINPTSFEIGFTNFRNASLKNIIDRAYNTLAERLKFYSEELSLPKPNGKKITYASKRLEIETRDTVYIFTFFGEFRTLPSLIARYCYELNPKIKFVTPAIKHRSTEIGEIKISHPEPIKLMQDAIKKIMVDLNTFKSAFAKI